MPLSGPILNPALAQSEGKAYTGYRKPVLFVLSGQILSERNCICQNKTRSFPLRNCLSDFGMSRFIVNQLCVFRSFRFIPFVPRPLIYSRIKLFVLDQTDRQQGFRQNPLQRIIPSGPTV